MNLGGLNLPRTTPTTPVKVYCDASMNHANNISSAGWLFTKHTGEAVAGNGCNLGKMPTTNQAERESIKRAIDILNSYNQVQHLKVYTDSKESVKTLDHGELQNGNFESVSIEWIPREENTIADGMARVSMNEEKTTPDPKYSICD